MTSRLLLDEHYSDAIAVALRDSGYDVIAAVADSELRGGGDLDLYRYAAGRGRRVVTENIKDFRPILLQAVNAKGLVAPLLLVPPRRFPRGRGDRTATIVTALRAWLDQPDVERRPLEDWLA